ncbi:MAG TPA: c-type cytochrome domain-containing protein [Pirellulales bacterium]|nr:c-type cytochrome domain-containing protein [Pirellulales bacterium]
MMSKRSTAPSLPGFLLLAAAQCLLVTSAAGLRADEPAAPAAVKISYDEHVRPILREHCATCHNQDTKKSDLAIDSYTALMQGGAGGAVILPGDLDGSRLWALVSHSEEPKMPPNQDKLADAKLQTIRAWILGGALENAGSTAKAAKKPAMNLSLSAGSAKPTGPAILPEGLWRQPVVSTSRPGAVTALASSPWAPLVAVAGQKQVLLYHSDSGDLLGVLPFPEGVPFVLKFSRSGALLLAGGGQGARQGRVVVFDVRTGQRVFEVGDELDVVLAADINQDHSRIALGGPGKVVRVFSTADGAVVQEIRKHTDWIYALEFSPDGVLLATADRSGGVFVWEADTGREYQNLQGHKGPVTDVAWRLDSNLLATASEDGTIKLWEMENGSQVKSWVAHQGGVASVRFAPDGRLASAGRDRIAKLWDGGGGQVRAFDALGDIALRVAFTHDGARMVAGDWLGEVRLWEAADGKLVATLTANPPTLAMRVESETQKVAVATKSLEQAAGELKLAQASLDEKTKALGATVDALAAGTAVAQKAAADQAAAKAIAETKEAQEKAVAEQLAKAKAAATAAGAPPELNAAVAAIEAELGKVTAEKGTVAKSAADLALASKAADERVVALQATVTAATAAKAADEQVVAAKAAAHKAAADLAAQSQAALERAVAEKAAYETAQAANQPAAANPPAAATN